MSPTCPGSASLSMSLGTTTLAVPTSMAAAKARVISGIGNDRRGRFRRDVVHVPRRECLTNRLRVAGVMVGGDLIGEDSTQGATTISHVLIVPPISNVQFLGTSHVRTLILYLRDGRQALVLIAHDALRPSGGEVTSHYRRVVPPCDAWESTSMSSTST